jgi:hypothetical protein
MYTNNIRFFIGSLTLVVLLVVLTCVANAQQATCESRDTVLQTIKGKFNEQLVFRGISKRGHITLIYLNDKTGSWTATIIRPTDPTAMCGVDVGTTGEAISNAQKTLYQQELQ